MGIADREGVHRLRCALCTGEEARPCSASESRRDQRRVLPGGRGRRRRGLLPARGRGARALAERRRRLGLAGEVEPTTCARCLPAATRTRMSSSWAARRRAGAHAGLRSHLHGAQVGVAALGRSAIRRARAEAIGRPRARGRCRDRIPRGPRRLPSPRTRRVERVPAWGWWRRLSPTAPRAPAILLFTPTCWWPTWRGTHEGRFGALDARAIYRCGQDRRLPLPGRAPPPLTKALGVEWRPRWCNGAAEIEGVPREVIDAFSRRRREIAERRWPSAARPAARAAEMAALDTRSVQGLRRLGRAPRRRVGGACGRARLRRARDRRQLDRRRREPARPVCGRPRRGRARRAPGADRQPVDFTRRDVVRTLAERSGRRGPPRSASWPTLPRVRARRAALPSATPKRRATRRPSSSPPSASCSPAPGAPRRGRRAGRDSILEAVVVARDTQREGANRQRRAVSPRAVLQAPPPAALAWIGDGRARRDRR